MSGLFRRKKAAAEEPPTEPAPTGEAVVLPAGSDLDKLVGEPPTTRRRGRLRRRLRHLRGVREVLLRDLGGMVFEVHRAGTGTGEGEGESPVVTGKLARLAAVDAELRELEALLDDRRGMVVREPGIGGTCPNCGELFGSDARFCWACGIPVAPGAQRPPEAVAAAALVTTSEHVDSTGFELPPPPPPPPPPAP